MNPTIQLDERVEVAVVFKKDDGLLTKSLPAKMMFRGKEVIFTELAMSYKTYSGKKIIHVYNMSDGTNDYRLEFDAERLMWRVTEMIDNS